MVTVAQNKRAFSPIIITLETEDEAFRVLQALRDASDRSLLKGFSRRSVDDEQILQLVQLLERTLA